MKQFYSSNDVSNLNELVLLANGMKANPLKYRSLGEGKLIVMLFFNASLRTRLSTQKAAMNLGMQVISMDMKESWAWEFQDGQVMDTDKAEHIKEAAAVISSYADIIAIRSFPKLENREEDYSDHVIRTFIKYSTKPVINMESAIRHPLQSLADIMTIENNKKSDLPKIVLTWAPHPKALPQAVSNSFLEWTNAAGYPVIVTHPENYELDESFMQGHHLEYNQEKAFKDADFVYVKNWSSTKPYGQRLCNDSSWKVDLKKLQLTNNARLMHCLPVRRNVVIADDAMDSNHSVIPELAENRLHTAQAVIYKILKEYGV